MSNFLSVIIILLAMVIQAFLQLTPGLFSYFYHHALGKTSVKKADDESLSFILGTEIFTAITFLIIYIIISFIATEKVIDNNIYNAILAGVFIAEAIITFFFYYHRNKKFKKSTALFLSRHLTKILIMRAEKVKNRSDTITLGLVTSALEFFFTLPLYIIISTEISHISPRYGFVYIIAYIIIATIPLFAIRTAFKTDHNLAEIQRFRVKNKLPIRLILSVSYLLIAILIIVKGWL